MSTIVELNSVTKSYTTGDVETVALSDASLRISEGEFVAIIGPSGSGKSTLMNLIGCLDVPTSGVVKIANHNVAQLEDQQLTSLRAQSVGFVFQQFQLLPRLSAIENVMAPLIYRGVNRKLAKERAARVLTDLGLGERLNFDRAKLSGGQQQRVAIARALVTEPLLILADEPTGALDSDSGAAVMEILTKLNKSGTTVVLITHDPEIAARAPRRIHIRDGRLTKDESDAA